MPGVAFSVVSASHVCSGKSGALTAKAMKKPTNSQRSAVVDDVDPGEVGDQVRRVAGVGGDDVQADHRGQQDQAAAELVHQELQRGEAPTLTTEAADQEVGRDQRGLEDDVEEEHVGGGEDRDRERLQGQHPGEERRRVALVGLVPGGDHDDRDQHDGQQDHHQAEAVDAERVVGAEEVDPLVLLGELHALAGVVAGGHDRGPDERQQGEPETDLLGEVGGPGQERRDRGAHEGHQDQRREPGEVVHARFTARRARTTSSTPPRRERA